MKAPVDFKTLYVNLSRKALHAIMREEEEGCRILDELVDSLLADEPAGNQAAAPKLQIIIPEPAALDVIPQESAFS